MKTSLFIGREISAGTKSWLVAEKIGFEEHPFIRIELSKPILPVFSSQEKRAKQIVVSSQWAAKWLVKFKTEIGFETNDSVLCLSEKQKEICSAVSENVLVATQQNALSLAQLASQTNRGGLVVYLRGDLSLDTFELEMKSLGIGIQKLEVYRNVPVLIKLEKTFDVYLFFSPSGAENFVKSGNLIPHTSAIAAIGAATGTICKALFNREIIISKTQEELATVKLASTLLIHSEIRLHTI